MFRPTTLIAALVILTSTCYAQEVACSLTSKCPADKPCCSQYGVCGVGAYCLGGCDPRMSNSLQSCVPEPVCKSKTYTWKDMSGITEQASYLGNANSTDWVITGEAVPYDDSLLLTMAPGTVGTVLASANYMWYGSVEATFKTSRGAGVVTAFILLSDVKDEIDYEFVGNERTAAQSNYYFQGVLNYTQATNITVSDTFANFHTYKIDWTPDEINWYVDGQLGRKMKRSDTWNVTGNNWAFPQTPMRVQLSIWPGGLASNAPGTVAWAGGPIDWTSNAPDIAANGYYYAQFKTVTISCYDAKTAPGTNLHNSYTYDSYAGTNDTVIDGFNPTVLSSLLGTGTNLSAVPASAHTSEVASIPGLVGGGVQVGVAPIAGNGSTSPSSSSSGSGTSDTDSSGSDTAGSPVSTQTGWSQGLVPASNSKSQAGGSIVLGTEGKRTFGASLFAAVLAVGAMLLL